MPARASRRRGATGPRRRRSPGMPRRTRLRAPAPRHARRGRASWPSAPPDRSPRPVPAKSVRAAQLRRSCRCARRSRPARPARGPSPGGCRQSRRVVRRPASSVRASALRPLQKREMPSTGSRPAATGSCRERGRASAVPPRPPERHCRSCSDGSLAGWRRPIRRRPRRRRRPATRSAAATHRSVSSSRPVLTPTQAWTKQRFGSAVTASSPSSSSHVTTVWSRPCWRKLYQCPVISSDACA